MLKNVECIKEWMKGKPSQFCTQFHMPLGEKGVAELRPAPLMQTRNPVGEAGIRGRYQEERALGIVLQSQKPRPSFRKEERNS